MFLKQNKKKCQRRLKNKKCENERTAAANKTQHNIIIIIIIIIIILQIITTPTTPTSVCRHTARAPNMAFFFFWMAFLFLFVVFVWKIHVHGWNVRPVRLVRSEVSATPWTVPDARTGWSQPVRFPGNLRFCPADNLKFRGLKKLKWGDSWIHCREERTQ